LTTQSPSTGGAVDLLWSTDGCAIAPVFGATTNCTVTVPVSLASISSASL
jgi:hypothetical protein